MANPANNRRACTFSGYRRVPLEEGTHWYRKFGPFFYNSVDVELCRAGKARARCWNPQAWGFPGRPTHSEMHKLIAANPTPCSSLEWKIDPGSFMGVFCAERMTQVCCSHRQRFEAAWEAVKGRHFHLFASLKD
jgi:hypothetical protein